MGKKHSSIEDEDSTFVCRDEVLDFSVRTKNSHLFTVHINKEIMEPSYYARVFDMMLEAGEDDVVQFLIASPGGRVDGLNILLEGIRATEAHTVGIIIGEASSAAAILALNCDEVATTASGEMLVHCIRYGTFGKASDISAHVLHTNKTSEKLFRNTFHGFLTEQEIAQVLDGREMFLDSDDISERLERRDQFFEQLEKVATKGQECYDVQAEVEEITVEKPKARKTRGTK